MSLAINPVNVVNVQDPVTDINNSRTYVVLRGGANQTYKVLTTNSYTNTSFQFSAPAPSPNTIIDRKMALRVPMTIAFVGTAPLAQNLLQTNFDALRSHPLSSVMETLEVQINNTSVSINMNDVVHPLLRFNTPYNVRQREYSVCPSMMDTFQTYDQGSLTMANPLGNYFDSVGYRAGRGSFPCTVVQANPGGAGNATATITTEITEFLMLSPFSFGHYDQPGFIGVQTMDFNITFMNTLHRIWSHSNLSNGVIDTITVTFQQPSLLFRYITPDLTVSIPRATVLPFYKVQRYITSPNLAFAVGQTRTLQSDNIQLQSIPRRMYILAQRPRFEKIGVNGHLYTDTYFNISGLNINFNNISGIFSSASEQDLYRMAIKNGLDMSWTQWHGRSLQMAGLDNDEVTGCGSIACVEFGSDLCLPPGLAPGVNGTFQLQFQVTCTNINIVSPGIPADTGSITPELYLIIINEGTFTIRDNISIPQIGVLSAQDCLNARKSPYIDYNMIRDAYGSGSFWSGVRDFFGRMWKGIKKGVKRIGPIAKIAIPAVQQIAPLLGLGGRRRKRRYRKRKRGSALVTGIRRSARGGRKRGRKRKYKKRGGIAVGGKMYSRSAMMKRLMK